jgi:hypothetical protein
MTIRSEVNSVSPRPVTVIVPIAGLCPSVYAAATTIAARRMPNDMMIYFQRFPIVVVC